jgi:hypothetical protein
MKRNTTNSLKAWEMRAEYDLSNARPNKYVKKYVEGTNIVFIEPDLIEFFPDSDSVNAALRALVSTFPKSTAKRKSKGYLKIKHKPVS